MKRIIVVVSSLLFIFVKARAEDLKKLALDDASAIGLEIQTDSNIKIEGKSSIKVTTLWPTTVCIGEVSGLDVDITLLKEPLK